MVDPLKRIDVSISAKDLLTQIASEFDLGQIKKYSPVQRGLSEANFRLETTRGVWFVKVFSVRLSRTLKGARNIVNALDFMHKKGIPVAQIYKSKNGKALITIKPKKGRSAYACVMSYIDGHDLSDQDVTDSELKTISRNLAKVNKLDLNLKGDYDTWYVMNYLNEYKRCLKYIDKKYEPIILDIAKQFKKIDFSKLRKGFIHADLQREHVLKSKNKLYFIDFMLNVGPVVADLAITMSDFCIDLKKYSNKKEFLRRYKLMLKEYQKVIKLSDYEIRVLPLLIKANYAIYYFHASRSFSKNKDPLNKNWIEFGKIGLDNIYPLDF